MAIMRGDGKQAGKIMEACHPDNASSIGKPSDKSNIHDAGPATKAPYGNSRSGVVKDYM